MKTCYSIPDAVPVNHCGLQELILTALLAILSCVVRLRAEYRRVLDDFLESLRRERRYSDQTLRAYRVDLEQFMDFCQVRLAARPLGELTHTDIRDFLGQLLRGGYERRSSARKLSAVKSLFRHLVSTGTTWFVIPVD